MLDNKNIYSLMGDDHFPEAHILYNSFWLLINDTLANGNNLHSSALGDESNRACCQNFSAVLLRVEFSSKSTCDYRQRCDVLDFEISTDE